jgi:hypothetical protein
VCLSKTRHACVGVMICSQPFNHQIKNSNMLNIPHRGMPVEMPDAQCPNGKGAQTDGLGASPLDDIRNTRKINAVVLKGKMLTRTDLDKLLQDVAAKAAAAPLPKEISELKWADLAKF